MATSSAGLWEKREGGKVIVPAAAGQGGDDGAGAGQRSLVRDQRSRVGSALSGQKDGIIGGKTDEDRGGAAWRFRSCGSCADRRRWSRARRRRLSEPSGALAGRLSAG